MRFLIVSFMCFVVLTHIVQAEEMLRFKIAVDEFGNCIASVKVKDQPIEKATDFKGKPLKISRLPNAKILKNEDGMVRIIT